MVHPLFQDLPEYLSDTLDDTSPLVEGRVHDHTRANYTRPDVYKRKFPELCRPIMSEAEAKNRLKAKRPPEHIQVWIDEMLLRTGQRPDNLIMLWDPKMPRWSFWCRSKWAGNEEGYARVWIVGELEADSRGKATDLDERAEYENLGKLMGPYRLPERHEIDHTMGYVARLDPWALDAYLAEKEAAAEEERSRQMDDWTHDYVDYRKWLDDWIENDGVRTWCVQNGWEKEREKEKRAAARRGMVEVDMGTHRVRVKKGSAFHRKLVAELEARSHQAKPEDQRDLEFVAKETRLGRVRKHTAKERQRTL